MIRQVFRGVKVIRRVATNIFWTRYVESGYWVLDGRFTSVVYDLPTCTAQSSHRGHKQIHLCSMSMGRARLIGSAVSRIVRKCEQRSFHLLGSLPYDDGCIVRAQHSENYGPHAHSAAGEARPMERLPKPPSLANESLVLSFQ